MIERFCITCNESGHTYLECTRVPFIDLFRGAIGAPHIVGKSDQELVDELQKIESEKDNG